MNRYEARQRTDGRWDWTVENDGFIHRAGPCDLHDDGHSTKEEAERHFYQDQIKSLREVQVGTEDTLHRCQFMGCTTFSCRGLVAPRWVEMPTWLCERHFTKECFSNIHPFKPGIVIWASW